MTTWLTDQPEVFRRYVPAHVASSFMPFRASEHASDRVALTFGEGKQLWCASIEGEDRTVVLMDHASHSQFDTALSALKSGVDLPDRLVCVALTGSNFRGQRQRPWKALRGNLHFTSHYRIAGDAAAMQAALTMAPAVATAQAIERITGGHVRPRIKWINDVLIDDQKVSGVLTATHVMGKNIERAVLGIGINLEQAPEIIPTPFVPAAGCLVDSMPALRGALPELLDALITSMDTCVEWIKHDARHQLFACYAAYADMVGRSVCIWPEGTEQWQTTPIVAQGKVSQLNPDLSLILDHHDQPIRSGRLAYEEFCRDFGLLNPH